VGADHRLGDAGAVPARGGPGIVVAVTILTVLLSLYELLRARLSRWHAALATILVAVSPPVLGYLTALQRTCGSERAPC